MITIYLDNQKSTCTEVKFQKLAFEQEELKNYRIERNKSAWPERDTMAFVELLKKLTLHLHSFILAVLFTFLQKQLSKKLFSIQTIELSLITLL